MKTWQQMKHTLPGFRFYCIFYDSALVASPFHCHTQEYLEVLRPIQRNKQNCRLCNLPLQLRSLTFDIRVFYVIKTSPSKFFVKKMMIQVNNCLIQVNKVVIYQ